MIVSKNRKEVALDEQTITLLQMKAEKEGRKLKNYMERVLIETANEFALSDEYKSIMDGLLKSHDDGTLTYISEEEFLTRAAR